jgi:hypothetical protein
VLVATIALGGVACSSTPVMTAYDSGSDAGPDDAGRRQFAVCEGAVVPVISGGGEGCGCAGRERCWGSLCTLQCAPCSAASPCPNGGECQFIGIPDCVGSCVYSVGACDAGVAEVSGTVELVSYGCRSGSSDACLWRQAFDTSRQTIRCSLAIETLGGTTLFDFGARDAGRTTNWMAATSAGTCRSSKDFLSPSCLTANAEVRIKLDAGTVRVEFVYGTSSGLQPTAEFRSFVKDVRTACTAAFRSWDGGTYPFID